MAVRKAPLTPSQFAILKWVGEGCVEGVYEGWAHRVGARALHNHGLILVKGHGPSWVASITKDGAYYLEHGNYLPRDRPDRDVPDTPDRERRPEIAPAATKRSRVNPSARSAAAPSQRSSAQKQGPVDQFMLSLQEADDHRILVPTSEGARYRQLVGFAKRFERIPEGMRLSFDYVRQEVGYMLAITLERLPEWQIGTLIPSRVSTRAQDTSDVVQTIMDSETFSVHGDPRNRALRLLEALVVGARESGMTVSAKAGRQAQRSGYGGGRSTDDEIRFMIDRDEFQLRFTQATLQRPHVPTERELARARRGYMFPDFDDVPDEKLGIVLEGAGGRFWADSWKDADGHRLEDDLAQILEEIRLRHGHLAERRVVESERQRQAQQERAEQEKRLAAARERAAVAHREHLIDEEARDQARRWIEANQMRAYAEEVRRHASSLAADDHARALQWAERITTVANATDPFPDHAVYPHVVAEAATGVHRS